MWNALKKKPLGLTGLVILGLVLFAAVFARWLVPHDPYEINLTERLQAPSTNHPFGTDTLGRDIFSRILYGAGIALRTSSLVVLIALPLGTGIGAVAGFAGGLVDDILMRLTDVFLSIPGLILAMAVAAVLGPSLHNVILALALVWWTWYARLSRASVMQVKNLPYIEAAQALGNTPGRLLLRHILPNSMTSVWVNAALDLGFVMLAASGLSFIGLGAQPPAPEWGMMLSESRSIMRDAWWAATFPGLAIFLTVMGFNLFGAALQEIFEPRLSETVDRV